LEVSVAQQEVMFLEDHLRHLNAKLKRQEAAILETRKLVAWYSGQIEGAKYDGVSSVNVQKPK